MERDALASHGASQVVTDRRAARGRLDQSLGPVERDVGFAHRFEAAWPRGMRHASDRSTFVFGSLDTMPT